MSGTDSLGITAIEGLKVGHCTDPVAATGCTVVLCEAGAVGGVDVRGSAPGTRETDLLRPMNLVQEVHAILLSGGSAFGLDAAGGVMAYLEERGVGFKRRYGVVPIVPAAILDDLGIGDSKTRPGHKEGYQACCTASSGAIAEGSVGAGAGATVGKVLGIEWATKGGIGTAGRTLADGTIVAAIVAVNAMGEVVDPSTGETLAGPRRKGGVGFHNTVEVLTRGRKGEDEGLGNTTIGVVATNTTLNKEGANKLAQMAQDGLAMAIRPAHTMGDGDTIFSLATGKGELPYQDVTALGAVAAQVMAEAITRAVLKAIGLAGVPAATDLQQQV